MRADVLKEGMTAGGRRKRLRRRLLPVLLTVGGVALIVAALHAFGIVINETPSLPLGFYRKQPHRAVEKGCFVLFELPETETLTRPYARGQLIKQVAATAGDRVTVCEAGVFVNGSRLENSAPMTTDLYGQALPHVALENYELGTGEVLAMSTHHPRSFDGRYFGLIRRDQIRSVLASVWTWGAASGAPLDPGERTGTSGKAMPPFDDSTSRR